jgi:Cft2 family RNA processing exonuclease
MRFTNLTRGGGIGANSYLLELHDGNLVLDCGMHPEHVGHDATPMLELLGEREIRSTILTHAHQDHVGCLPLLQAGRRGMPVLMTPGTARIAEVMLHNSVNVMVRQRGEKNLEDYPLFSHRSIDLATRTWRYAPLGRPLDTGGERTTANDNGTSVTFHDAGHILGSAGVTIRSGKRTFFYTGDVNFEDQTIQTGASFPEEQVDVLLMETTRGDSPVPEGFTRKAEEERFAKAVGAALEEGSSVTIPVFALGKTQELMAILWGMIRRGVIPPVPLYIGGLGSKICAVYDSMNPQVPRNLRGLHLMSDLSPYVAGGAEITNLSPRKRAIYALSSGMMTENTLSNIFASKVLPDPSQHLFFVGYADPSSPAGRIRSASDGEEVTLSPGTPPLPLRCRRESFTLSAHARREDLLAFALKVRPKTLLLVHGDEPAIEWFRREVTVALPETRVIAPPPGETIDL